jgi:ribosomal protein L13E
LAFALDAEISEGVWGGSNRRERAELRRAGVTGEMVRRFGPYVDSGRVVLLDERFDEMFGRLADLLA